MEYRKKKSTRKRWTIPKTGTSGSQKRIPNSQQIWQNYSNPLMIREMKIRTLWYRFTYIQLRNHINTKNLQNWGGGGHRYSHTTVNKKIGTTTNFTAPTRAEDEHTLQPSSFTSCDTIKDPHWRSDFKSSKIEWVNLSSLYFMKAINLRKDPDGITLCSLKQYLNLKYTLNVNFSIKNIFHQF